VTDPAERERRLAAHAAALDSWAEAKQHYDDVLYPAFRAAQLRRAAAEYRDAKRRRVASPALALEAQCRAAEEGRVVQAAIEESARRAAHDEAEAKPLVEIVRGLWVHFGFLNIPKLRAELDPDRRARGSGKLQPSRHYLTLPAELREPANRERLEQLEGVAWRIVKAERLAAGLTVDASNYARRQRIQMEQVAADRKRRADELATAAAASAERERRRKEDEPGRRREWERLESQRTAQLYQRLTPERRDAIYAMAKGPNV